MRTHTLAASWESPFFILDKIGLVTYRIKEVGLRRIKTTHINNLKPYKEVTPSEVCALTIIVDEKDILSAHPITAETSHPDFKESYVTTLADGFPNFFKDNPGQCSAVLVSLPIHPDTPVISQPPRRLAETIKPQVHQDIQDLLAMDIIEPSESVWCSPYQLLSLMGKFVSA